MTPTKTVANIMRGHVYVEIFCALRGALVRRLVRVDEIIEIHAADGSSAAVPADARVWYEPWVFDRGSLLVDLDGAIGMVKLCTEGDVVVGEDGSRWRAEP